jgi:hypothetical protein
MDGYEGGKIIHQTTYHPHYSRITGVTLVGKGSTPPRRTPEVRRPAFRGYPTPRR